MAEEIWTIKAALDWTAGYLERKGDESPLVSAQWLLSEATGLSRVELYVNYDRPLSMGERDLLRGYVTRRGRGEPLQYITGEVGFRHLMIRVRPGVLIPRPETEVLVSEVLAGLPTAERPRSAEFLAEMAELAETAKFPDANNADAPMGMSAEPSAVPVLSRGGEPIATSGRTKPGFGALATCGELGSLEEKASRAQLEREGFEGNSPVGNVSRETFVPFDSKGEETLSAEAVGSSAPAPSAFVLSCVPSFAPAPSGASSSASAPSASFASALSGAFSSKDCAYAGRRLLVADICTGSGCIACSLAFEHPDVHVVATDIAPEALSLAQENVERLGLGGHVEVLESDLGESVPAGLLGSFDAVVSNPPYVPTAILGEIPKEVADYEPALALDGGEDGLELYRRLLTWAELALRPRGLFACELHETCLDAAAELARATGFENVRIVYDLAGKPRVLTAVKP